MKILEEIKENLTEGKRSPMEEIYETRKGFFMRLLSIYAKLFN